VPNRKEFFIVGYEVRGIENRAIAGLGILSLLSSPVGGSARASLDLNALLPAMVGLRSQGADPLVTQDALDRARKQVDQNTHPAVTDFEKSLVSELKSLGNAMNVSSEELQGVRIGKHGTWACALSDTWMYRVDSAGNQTFRPVSNLPGIAPSLTESYTASYRAPNGRAEQLTHTLASTLGCLDVVQFDKAINKHEVIFVQQCNTNEKSGYVGRHLTRLCNNDGTVYFQVIFDKDCKPLRIDTNVQTSVAKKLGSTLLNSISGRLDSNPPLVDTNEPYTLGTFFNSNEYRFETNACSYEGSDQFSLTTKSNPFTRTITDSRFEGMQESINYNSYRQTPDSGFWQYYWWSLAGRSGGFRGNWIAGEDKWQRQNVQLLHRSLNSYGYSDRGLENGMNQVTVAGGNQVQTPHAVSIKLDDSFFADLRKCTVALFATHGGPIRGRFQLRRMLDVWFLPADSTRKLGQGNLNCVFFDGCGAMGSFDPRITNSADRTLHTEWLPGKYVDGLTLACGIDGESVGLDRTGWRVTAYYQKGDSVSDSWRNGTIEECDRNAPVSVAYGETKNLALENLVDWRISVKKSKSNFSAASVWM